MSGNFYVKSDNRLAVRRLLTSIGLPAVEVRMWPVSKLGAVLRENVASGRISNQAAVDACNTRVEAQEIEFTATGSTMQETPSDAIPKAVKPLPPPSDTTATGIALAVEAAIASALANVPKAPSRSELADMIEKAVEKARIKPLVIEVKAPTGNFTMTGMQHKAFPRLMRAVMARQRHNSEALNIWLYGPAGTGKSTAARKLAEQMGRGFETNGPIGSQWDIRGFVDAQGKIVDTAFRRAWVEGKVYCWDEGDGSAPSALIEANGALATGYASFPDGVFKRHPECIVIINGNLRPGAAPDATYNGRFKQDTAFVNRFVAIEWGIDEDLETALTCGSDAKTRKWLDYIRKIRRETERAGIRNIVVSPRQVQYGLALLDAGAEWDEAVDMAVRWMYTPDQWVKVS